MKRGYGEFRDEIIAALADYARDGSSAHLRSVAARFSALPPLDDVGVVAVRLNVFGWSARGGHVSARLLRRANPEWRIRVRRVARGDLGSSRWRSPGFRVTAIGRPDAPPLQFALARDEGATPTNSAVRAEMRELGWAIRSVGTPVAYLDDITRAPVVDRRPDLWIDALVSEHPAQLWEFADSPEGEPWRERLFHAVNARPATYWADRYELALGGSGFAPRSDLAMVHVRRPIPHDFAPADGLEILLLERHGDVVVSRGSGRRAPAPGSEWLVVEAAAIQGGGTVRAGDELICYELAADPANAVVAGQWDHVYGSRANRAAALLEPSVESAGELDEAILIGGRADENWYHWVVDYLARVLEIPADVPDDVPVLVSSRVPPQGLEALRELTQRPILVRNPALTTRVGRLHVAAPVVQLLDDPRGPWSEGFALRTSSLRRLRERWGVEETPTSDGRRLFLSRRSGVRRGIGNEPQLVEVAESAGLEIVDPAQLSVVEQRAMFGDASLVVGGSGAVMANYLFLRPGTQVVALTSRQLWDFVMPAALASLAGAEFRYLTGPSSIALADVPTRSEWIHAPFTIDPTLLAGALADLRVP